jgi:hypothetical protein
VPRTTPDAPSARRAAICAPVDIPPAAMMTGPSGMASSTPWRRFRRGGAAAPPCPPASVPVQINRKHG